MTLGPPQSRPVALWGEEAQRNERALAEGRDERYGACADEGAGDIYLAGEALVKEV